MVAPLLKWPGGKTRELPAILAALPHAPARLVDPFVGGGAVLFALPPTIPAVVNDASDDLMDLYTRVRALDPELDRLGCALGSWWDALGPAVAGSAAGVVTDFVAAEADPATVAERAGGRLAPLAAAVAATVPSAWATTGRRLVDDLATLVPPKLGRMRAVERRRGHRLPDPDVWANVEGAVRAALYTRVRSDYNAARAAARRSARQAVRFLFLRELAYAAMFRFNQQGEFNVPYGGITYNRKSLADRFAHLRSTPVRDRLAATTLACGDFEAFLAEAALREDDVVFLDPPYDSDFSSYDGRGFGPDDHARLAGVMRALPCPFVMVVKDSPLVRRLYVDPAWQVRAFDHTYAWTIKSRNDRRATHLLVTDVAPSAAAAAG